MSDLFLACYKITTPGVGGPVFNVHLSVYPAQETVHGFGRITQAISPPLDIATKLDGCYFPILLMGTEKISVSGTGYPDINWPPLHRSSHGGIGPVLLPNLKLQMLLDEWQEGVASYKYKDNNDNWQTITNAKVELDNSSILVPQKASAPITSDFKNIVITSGKVLDGTGLEDGDNVLLWSKKGSDNNENQKWTLEDAGNGYYFITTTNSKVLDGTGLNSGDNVLLWSKKGSDNNENQKWKLEDAGNGYYFITTTNGLALDGTAQGEGDNVLLWTKTGGDNQKWKLEDPEQNSSVPITKVSTPIEGNFKNIVITSGNVLDGTGLKRGDNVALWSKKGSDNNENQKWKLEDAGDGYYFITTTNDLVLNPKSIKSGGDVALWSKKRSDNNKNQKWKLEDAGDGYYFITTHNGLVLDGSAQGEGDNVLLWAKTGADNQKWKLEDAS